MSKTEILNEIWKGDRLDRRHEASNIEKYIVTEIATLRALGRDHSIVLGIDSPYGIGKSWFLERLGRQLSLSHPVARIDAWADDIGDEPLTAFMAAIDDALAPYISKSQKLRDRMAAVKVAALPVMGKLVSGALVKALTKVAGDEINDDIGETIENAVRGVKEDPKGKEDGAAAKAVEGALDKLGEEINSLVDRRGAAMLAAYRQRRQSRKVFRENIRNLVSGIRGEVESKAPPLVIIIDELDRCRPNYAIKILEEIKHFFEVPGLVFIIGLHGGQLSKSVRAIYGNEFDGEDYLRRFFTRRYALKDFSIVELCAAIFEEWGIDEEKFKFPDFMLGATYRTTKPRLIGIILAQWSVTPREIFYIIDALRLFVSGWEHPDPIEPMAILSLIVKMVRGQELNFTQPHSKDDVLVTGDSVNAQGDWTRERYSISTYLNNLSPLAWNRLSDIGKEQAGSDASRNYLVEWLLEEWNSRRNRSPKHPPHQSHIADYIPRIVDLARFIDEPASGIDN